MTDAIRTNAAGPASASSDGVSATQHNLRDQIAADKHLAARAAARNPAAALRFGKFKATGSV